MPVFTTRLRPNSFSRLITGMPGVDATGGGSSKIQIMVLSWRISYCTASRTAYMKLFFAMVFSSAKLPGEYYALDEYVFETVLGLAERLLVRPRGGFDLIGPGARQHAPVDEDVAADVDRIALHPVAHLALRTERSDRQRVVTERAELAGLRAWRAPVVVIAIGLGLDQRRPFAGARAIHRVLGGVVDLEHVLSVHN